MSEPVHVVAYDVGTTGAKACLYRLRAPSGPGGRGGCVELVASAVAEYPLRLLSNGGAEQDPEDWWSGLCRATRLIMDGAGVGRGAVRAISFCCQMQGLVLVDADGVPVRPAMTYMDQRATEQKRRGIERGLRIARHERAEAAPLPPHHRRGVGKRQGSRLEVPLGPGKRARRFFARPQVARRQGVPGAPLYRSLRNDP